MKKPTKPPPPPPCPPRSHSPARSYCSLPTQNCGSEYYDSYYQLSESNYNSCGSGSTSSAFRRELQYNIGCSNCSSRYYSPCSTCCTSSCCNGHSRVSNQSPCTSNCSYSSRIIQTLPPVPKERISRPRLSISPMPELKKNADLIETYTETASNYKRHIEQHIRRITKYLKDREERLQHVEKKIETSGYTEKHENTFLTILAKKESQYLRSLRARISPSNFIKICELGSGYIGNVWLVKKKETDSNGKGQYYAMKILKKVQVFKQNHMAHVMAERDILAEADNDWIVKLYYSFQDNDYLYFILEFIPGGDMMNLLSEENVFPEDWAQFYIAEISLALQFVHDMGFIHRDIKPDNILIDAKGHIKLTDFGLCTGFRWTHDSNYYKDDTLNSNQNICTQLNGCNKSEDHPTITKALTEREIEYSKRKRSLSLVGSPNYIAPEVLRQAFCEQKNTNERLCDWWSVGVILYEMVVGYCPFIDLEQLKQNTYDPARDRPERIQMRILEWKKHLIFPSDPRGPGMMNKKDDPPGYKRTISNATERLIRGLLCDPQDRLCQNGIVDIKDHEFFNTIDWENIRSTTAPFVPRLVDEHDTSHFGDQLAQTDGFFNCAGTTSKMQMNDFTYKYFSLN